VRAFGIPFDAALYVFAGIVAVYVLFGGLKGVMATEALQGGIMLFGMLVLLGVTYSALGGVTPAHEALSELEAPARLQAIGHRGYTSMPDFGWASAGAQNPAEHHLWWIMVSGIIMGVGIGVLAQPQLVVRFMTVPSRKSLNRAVAPGAFFIFAVIGTVYVVGPLSNVFFRHHETIACTVVDDDVRGYIGEEKGKPVVMRVPQGGQAPQGAQTLRLVAYALPGQDADEDLSYVPARNATWEENPGGEAPHLLSPRLQAMERTVTFGRSPGGNADEVIPTYVTSAMPRWFGLLFLLTLLSAGMSTVASQFHTIGVSLGRDVFEQFSHRHSERSVLVARLGIGAGIVVAIVLGQVLRGNIVAVATAMFFGLCGATFLPAFVGGLFWRGMTRAGAVASMVAGFGSSMLWLAFVNNKVASALGICQALFGAPNLARHFPGMSLTWEVVDPLVVALPLSAVTAVVVSLLTRPLDPDHVAWCFGGPKKGPVAQRLGEAEQE
jgi:SSS family solute:Na+ symporter